MATPKKIAAKKPHKFQYAVKFICGSHTDPGTSLPSYLPKGNYSVSVNIHNPLHRKVELRKKLAAPGLITEFITSNLQGDEVERLTCANIPDFGITPVHGFEGFLVIESTSSLDVTAVYAAGNADGVVSIDVEQIRERKL